MDSFGVIAEVKEVICIISGMGKFVDGRLVAEIVDPCPVRE